MLRAKGFVQAAGISKTFDLNKKMNCAMAHILADCAMASSKREVWFVGHQGHQSTIGLGSRVGVTFSLSISPVSDMPPMVTLDNSWRHIFKTLIRAMESTISQTRRNE